MNGRERVRFDPIKPGFLAFKLEWLCEENALDSTGGKLRKYRVIYTVETGSEMIDKRGKHIVSHLGVPEGGDRRVIII